MTDILRGRQRRYFGYNRDADHKVDTPESAKSFRSVMSPVKRMFKRKYEPIKSFKADPPGHLRFADKIIHQAVKTQIPGLLPALKNSPQFDEFEDNPIFLRSPDFEQHVQRSLYYLWLQHNDRSELCNIFHRHFKAKERDRLLAAKRGRVLPGISGINAEAAAAANQEFLQQIEEDPRLKLRAKRLSEVPSRLLRMNRKFQTSYWDPSYNKSLQDPFRRGKNKIPAFDSICHEYFGSPDGDLLTCLGEYKRRYALNEDLAADEVELNEGREHLRRLTLFGTLDEEQKRRGFTHIKQLKDYDKESQELWEKQAKLMISGAEYINKIKRGRRFPTPPREIRRKPKGGGSTDSRKASSIDLNEYITQQQWKVSGKTRRQARQPRSPGSTRGTTTGGDRQPSQSPSRHHKHKHHHHNYNSEDFYMEMYLHFLNPDDDVTLKSPPITQTDVKELRKKMNLDEDHEKERKLIELLNSDSVEALHIHAVPRKIVSPHHPTPEEIAHEKEMLEHHLERLNNPRLTHLLTRIVSQMSLTSSKLTLSDTSEEGSGANKEEGGDEELTTTIPDTVMTVPSTGFSEARDDDDLDEIGDIPDHELDLIMSEIAVATPSDSSDNLSSASSGAEDEEDEGEGEAEAADDGFKLFKKVKKKKDSLAELMDLSADFRATVCKAEEGKSQGKMNPFAEAVCVLYPYGSNKKKNKATKTMTNVALALKKI